MFFFRDDHINRATPSGIEKAITNKLFHRKTSMGVSKVTCPLGIAIEDSGFALWRLPARELK